MRLMKRKFILIAVTLLLCTGIAFTANAWMNRVEPPDEKLVRSAKQSEHTLELYFNADYETAKQAISEHIKFLDKLSSESRDLRNPFAIDAILWNVRLAKLEEKFQRNGKEAYIKEALSRCQNVNKSLLCTEEFLR